jgi:hypothetical protein
MASLLAQTMIRLRSRPTKFLLLFDLFLVLNAPSSLIVSPCRDSIRCSIHSHISLFTSRSFRYLRRNDPCERGNHTTALGSWHSGVELWLLSGATSSSCRPVFWRVSCGSDDKGGCVAVTNVQTWSADPLLLGLNCFKHSVYEVVVVDVLFREADCQRPDHVF